MLSADPDNTMVLFGLANEYQKVSDWPNVISTLEEYLSKFDDEGAAYGMLARAFIETGDNEKARAAYGKGIETAMRHGHPTMAGEFGEAMEGMG
jgi:predicted Zn-dependent protease